VGDLVRGSFGKREAPISLPNKPLSEIIEAAKVEKLPPIANKTYSKSAEDLLTGFESRSEIIKHVAGLTAFIVQAPSINQYEKLSSNELNEGLNLVAGVTEECLGLLEQLTPHEKRAARILVDKMLAEDNSI
jgi:hypothetical protein